MPRVSASQEAILFYYLSWLPCFVNTFPLNFSAHYERLFKELQTQVHGEAVTGLLLIYPVHIIHVVEVRVQWLKAVFTQQIKVGTRLCRSLEWFMRTWEHLSKYVSMSKQAPTKSQAEAQFHKDCKILKWYRDQIFGLWFFLFHHIEFNTRFKMLLTVFKYVYYFLIYLSLKIGKICKLGDWWHYLLNPI